MIAAVSDVIAIVVAAGRGDQEKLKITTPGDFELAEALPRTRSGNA